MADEREAIALECLDALYAYAWRLTRRADEVDDLVQETYARFFARGDEYLANGGASARPILFRILRNLFIDQRRAAKRNPDVYSVDAMSDTGSDWTPPALATRDAALDAIVDESLSEEVERALAAIEPVFREALWLREVEELSYQEISDVTEVPIGTVRSRLARARAAFAEQLRLAAVQRKSAISAKQDPQEDRAQS